MVWHARCLAKVKPCLVVARVLCRVMPPFTKHCLPADLTIPMPLGCWSILWKPIRKVRAFHTPVFCWERLHKMKIVCVLPFVGTKKWNLLLFPKRCDFV